MNIFVEAALIAVLAALLWTWRRGHALGRATTSGRTFDALSFVRPEARARLQPAAAASASAAPIVAPIAAPPTVATPVPQTPQSDTTLLSVRQWLNVLNHQPDRVPHVAAAGASGSGKTTLILAALHDRPGRFLIVTPKSRRADPWGGLPVVRLRREDMSFEPIGAAVEAVYQEMLRRNAVDADVDDDWLTLIIDEFSTVIGKLPDLKERVLDMVTLGRSSRIRLILLATETNVKAWGWEGRGEARHNVVFVECEEDHSAALYRWGRPHHAMDTDMVPLLASRPLPLARWWTPPQSTQSARAPKALCADDLLFRDADAAEHPEHPQSALQSTSPEHPARAPRAPLDLRRRDDLVRLLVEDGLTANEIVARLKGDSTALYQLVAKIKAENNIPETSGNYVHSTQ